jgi:hypothetical protein
MNRPTRDESELVCRECDKTFQLEDGCEPADYCHGCVYNVIDALEVEVAAARRERDLFAKAGEAERMRLAACGVAAHGAGAEH